MFEPPLFGLRIVESPMVGEAYQDWTGVRSHGRARRRLKQGHPQNIVTRYRANGECLHDKARGIVYMHPADASRFRATIRNEAAGAGANARSIVGEGE